MKILEPIKYEEPKEQEAFVPFGTRQARMILPLCCREQHDDCPHVVHKEKKANRNIAL